MEQRLTDFYTVKEIAAMLNLSRRQVINMIEAGKFPGAYRLTQTRTSPWRVPKTAYQAFLANIQFKGE